MAWIAVQRKDIVAPVRTDPSPQALLDIRTTRPLVKSSAGQAVPILVSSSTPICKIGQRYLTVNTSGFIQMPNEIFNTILAQASSWKILDQPCGQSYYQKIIDERKVLKPSNFNYYVLIVTLSLSRPWQRRCQLQLCNMHWQPSDSFNSWSFRCNLDLKRNKT